jgi:hypothetical protein
MCTTATPEPVLPSRKRHVDRPFSPLSCVGSLPMRRLCLGIYSCIFNCGESAGLHGHGITLTWLPHGQIGLPRKPRELSVPPGVI